MVQGLPLDYACPFIEPHIIKISPRVSICFGPGRVCCTSTWTVLHADSEYVSRSAYVQEQLAISADQHSHNLLYESLVTAASAQGHTPADGSNISMCFRPQHSGIVQEPRSTAKNTFSGEPLLADRLFGPQPVMHTYRVQHHEPDKFLNTRHELSEMGIMMNSLHSV